MTDIVFVHPNASGIVYQGLSKDLSAIEPPIWACMLAQRARRDGYEVRLIDAEAERIDAAETAKRALALKPKLVVIVVYGQQPSASTQNMVGAQAIHKHLSMNCYTMFVGAHPSALPQQTIWDNRSPWTFVCEGEGPETIKAFMEHFVNTKWDKNFQSRQVQLLKVPGLHWNWYDGTTKKSTNYSSGFKAELIKDLDKDLPGMAWDLLDLSKYRTSNWHGFTNNNQTQPFFSIYTSLGCPFNCTFCMINTPFGGSSFRYWSPDFIVNQLSLLADKGIKNLKIADEMFVLNKNHFLVLCEKIIERKLDFNIWAYARIDTVKDKYLATLKKAGVNWLALGIESGNKAVRKDVIKGKFEDIDIKQIVKKIQDHGISVIGNFIFGLPEDTHESMRESLDMAKELGCEFVNFYSAMAYPGSYLYTEAIQNGTKLPDSWAGYSQHSYECQPLGSKHLTPAEVLKFRDAAFIECNSDPKYLEMLKAKFGQATVDNINNMLKHTLKRKLLE